MSNQQTIETALAKLVPLSLHRVTIIDDPATWEPLNREAGIEATETEVRVHLHVSNADDGEVTLLQMATEAQEAAGKADMNRAAPDRIILTYQQPKRGRDATTKT